MMRACTTLPRCLIQNEDGESYGDSFEAQRGCGVVFQENSQVNNRRFFFCSDIHFSHAWTSDVRAVYYCGFSAIFS